MSKRRAAKIITTYYAVQIDVEGRRKVTDGHATADAAARAIASMASWTVDTAELTSSWNACSPDGSERFEIGTDN